jgi:hypothetical protein
MHAGEVPAFRRVEAELPDPLRVRPALGQERDRLWQRWVTVDPQLDAHADLRSTETPVVVLEPPDRAA